MFNDIFKSHLTLVQSLSEHPHFLSAIQRLIDMMESTLTGGNQVLLCGNGGSAADAQHISAELSGRFYKNRPPLNVEALHVNSSFLTAVANDMGYDQVFSRALEAKGKEGDLLIALSTSGRSQNILNAIHTAKDIGIKTVALTGAQGNDMAQLCDHAIMVPSTDTPRIQEVHMLIGHIICQQIEERIFQ